MGIKPSNKLGKLRGKGERSNGELKRETHRYPSTKKVAGVANPLNKAEQLVKRGGRA